MERRHKLLIGVGLVVVLAGWLAWMALLTESDTEEPIENGAVAASTRLV